MKKSLIMTIIFTLLLAPISFTHPVEAAYEPSQQEIDQLAQELEFMFEEAAYKNSNGDFVDFNFELLKEKYGSDDQVILELEELVKPNSSVIQARTAAVDRCIERKIKAAYKEYFSVTAMVTIVNYIKEKNYKSASERILKAGVRGNIVGIMAQITYWLVTCIYEEEGWF
ncbi:hypothetical protein [Lysinibacillus xylanilyticus]|uniref:hypothetical protein n=1 Tax=Lysinibacillus xylanilyticus TaxID=582475 RepID=UPI003813F30C